MLASCQVLLDALGRPDFYFMEPSEAEEYEAYFYCLQRLQEQDYSEAEWKEMYRLARDEAGRYWYSLRRVSPPPGRTRSGRDYRRTRGVA
jgi:hypothetical protein